MLLQYFRSSFESICFSVQESKGKQIFKVAAILHFRSKLLLQFLDLQIVPILPTSFESVGLFDQEMKGKTYFQDGCHGGHLGFPILPTKFRVNWSFGSEERCKIGFQYGGHDGRLGFPIGTILTIFDLQVTQMLLTRFRVNWSRSVGGASF